MVIHLASEWIFARVNLSRSCEENWVVSSRRWRDNYKVSIIARMGFSAPAIKLYRNRNTKRGQSVSVKQRKIVIERLKIYFYLPSPAAAPPEEPPPRDATLSRRPVTASKRDTNFSKSAAILFRRIQTIKRSKTVYSQQSIREQTKQDAEGTERRFPAYRYWAIRGPTYRENSSLF